MELDLLPRRNLTLNTTDTLPEGMTHSDDEPCPFAHNDFPIGKHGTCCSFCGKVVAEQLEALGEADVANLVYEDLPAGAARAFASVLRSATSRIERRYPSRKDKSRSVSQGEDSDAETTSLSQPSFEAAITSIRQAADWYQKVGRLGFDVQARY